MTNIEKKHILKKLTRDGNSMEELYFGALVKMGDIKRNYRDYLVTEPINCDKELERLPEADYELCSALMTMLLREDHFNYGTFERRYKDGQVQSIIDRMLNLLEIKVN